MLPLASRSKWPLPLPPDLGLDADGRAVSARTSQAGVDEAPRAQSTSRGRARVLVSPDEYFTDWQLA